METKQENTKYTVYVSSKSACCAYMRLVGVNICHI